MENTTGKRYNLLACNRGQPIGLKTHTVIHQSRILTRPRRNIWIIREYEKWIKEKLAEGGLNVYPEINLNPVRTEIYRDLFSASFIKLYYFLLCN